MWVEERKSVLVRMNPKVLEVLDLMAKKLGMTRSDVLEEVICWGLEHLLEYIALYGGEPQEA